MGHYPGSFSAPLQQRCLLAFLVFKSLVPQQRTNGVGFRLFACLFASGDLFRIIQFQRKWTRTVEIWWRCLLHSNCVRAKNKSFPYKMLPLKQKVNCATKHFRLWAQTGALSIVQHKKIRFLKKKKIRRNPMSPSLACKWYLSVNLYTSVSWDEGDRHLKPQSPKAVACRERRSNVLAENLTSQVGVTW